MSVLAELPQPQNSRAWLQHPVLTYLARLGPLTRRQTLCRAEQLAAWLSHGAHNAYSLPWGDLKYEELIALRAGLTERYAPGTANNYLCTIRGIIKECWRHGLISGEEYRHVVDLPRIPGDSPPAGRDVQMHELRQMLLAIENEGNLKAVRDAAVVGVLYGTGMRASELAKLSLGDYDPHKVSFMVTGKGSKKRETFGPSWIREPLVAWLDIRSTEPGALFVSMEHGRVDRTYRHLHPLAVLAVVKTWAKRAGLEPIMTHDFRRTHIGDMLDAGVDVVTIGKNVGHKSPTTTARYDRRNHQTLKMAAEKLPSPF